MIGIANNAGRASIRNGTQPASKGLPESEIADMERVMDEIEVLLPTLGFDVLRPAGQKTNMSDFQENQLNKIWDGEQKIFRLDEANTVATAREVEGEFIVLINSLARRDPHPSCPESLRLRRKTMLEEGKLVLDEDERYLRFTTDVAFKSPSGAASVIYGGNSNGRKTWKVDGTNETYASYRQALLQSQQENIIVDELDKP